MGYLGSLLVAAIAVTVVGAHYCPAPRAPHYGRYYSRSGGPYRYYPVGHVIYYACDDGYQMYGYSKSDCYYDSKHHRTYWRYDPPVCRKSKSYLATQTRMRGYARVVRARRFLRTATS